MNEVKSLRLFAQSAALGAGATTATIFNSFALPLSALGNGKLQIIGFSVSCYVRDAGSAVFVPLDSLVTLTCDDTLNEKGPFDPGSGNYNGLTYQAVFTKDSTEKDFYSAEVSSTANFALIVTGINFTAALNDVAVCNFIMHYKII